MTPLQKKGAPGAGSESGAERHGPCIRNSDERVDGCFEVESFDMSGYEEMETELEKVEETLAMADRVIQIARQEHERLSADLPAAGDPAEASAPVVEPI